MEVLTRQGRSWVYALRRIVDAQGRFLRNDDCESLGTWPTFYAAERHVVDTSCYLLRRDLAVANSPLWFRRYREQTSPDILLCENLLRAQPNVATNGLYTVNYRVQERRTGWSVQAELFERGNREMAERYPEGFPWRASASQS